MSDNNVTKPKKSFSADWFVGGVLTRIGETFDRMLGRNWKPSSSLATSELIDRLKKLLDSEKKDLGEKGSFVPHNIKLKIQWNKISTESEDVIKKLEYELLAAAIDHINDNRYHTYKPLKIEIKTDYFTEGVKFYASFGEFDEEEKEAVVNITVPQMNVQELIPEASVIEPEGENYIVEFKVKDKQKSIELKFLPGKRIGVGRTKENDLAIDDPSISKIHAALVLNSDNQLMVADTGSTNGTFINGQRIAYGRAFPIAESDKLKFGMVEVFLRLVPKQTDFELSQSYQIDTAPTQNFSAIQNQPVIQETQAAVNIKQSTNVEATQAFIQPKVEPLKVERPTEVHPSNANFQNIPQQNSYQNDPKPNVLNETMQSSDTDFSIPVPPPPFETKSSIPVEQPEDFFEETPKVSVVNPPKIEEPKKDLPKENSDEKQSQVFNTEPRVKFNFGDDDQ